MSSSLIILVYSNCWCCLGLERWRSGCHAGVNGLLFSGFGRCRKSAVNQRKIIRSIPVEIRPWLEDLKKITGKSGLVLGEERTRQAVLLKARRLHKDFQHNELWTPHDLRRTFSTGLNNMGVPPHIVELLLGHALPGVMAIYNHSLYLPDVMAASSNFCTYEIKKIFRECIHSGYELRKTITHCNCFLFSLEYRHCRFFQ